MRGLRRLAWCGARGAVLPNAECTLLVERGSLFCLLGSFGTSSCESRHAPNFFLRFRPFRMYLIGSNCILLGPSAKLDFAGTLSTHGKEPLNLTCLAFSASSHAKQFR